MCSPVDGVIEIRGVGSHRNPPFRQHPATLGGEKIKPACPWCLQFHPRTTTVGSAVEPMAYPSAYPSISSVESIKSLNMRGVPRIGRAIRYVDRRSPIPRVAAVPGHQEPVTTIERPSMLLRGHVDPLQEGMPSMWTLPYDRHPGCEAGSGGQEGFLHHSPPKKDDTDYDYSDPDPASCDHPESPFIFWAT